MDSQTSTPKKPNHHLRKERELRGWSQHRLAEELGTSVHTVSKWERGINIPDPFYREKLITLFGKSAIELGFVEQEEILKVTPMISPTSITLQPETNILLDNNKQLQAPLIVDNLEKKNDNTILQNITTPQILVVTPISSYEVGTEMERRNFLRKSLATSAAFLTSPGNSLEDDFLNRFLSALKKPSTIDISTLNYLERRTANYWQDRHGAVLTSSDLLGYVQDDFHKVISLLESSLQPTVRIHLCVIASEISQLAGHLLFDMGNYVKAREYHNAAVIAAQEANHPGLQATAWGRMSLTWTYSKNPQEALNCIQEARRLALSLNTTVQSYLAALEAEIHALLGNRNGCFRALDHAENFDEHQSSNKETYWLRFGLSQLEGYRGACFQHLYKKDNKDISLLTSAQEVLKNALENLPSTRIQKRPVLLLDLASTYVKQGIIDEACNYATQAISIGTQMKSQTVLQRLLSLQQELSIWQDTPYVKNLNNQISTIDTVRK